MNQMIPVDTGNERKVKNRQGSPWTARSGKSASVLIHAGLDKINKNPKTCKVIKIIAKFGTANQAIRLDRNCNHFGSVRM